CDAELDAKCRQQDREGECYRTIRHLAAEHADEIERRYPKILRRVGGYNLDLYARGQTGVGRIANPSHGELAGSPSCFNLAPLLVGSEGTLAVTLEAKLRIGDLPRAKA